MKTASIIDKRWSPRAFDETESLTREQVDSLFEAARWAPSSMNEQPWLYYYTTRKDSVSFSSYMDCLMPGNSSWAQRADLIILSVARKKFRRNNKPNRHALHDTGAANVLLALRAAEMGLQAHQMGGFDIAKTVELFNLDPEMYEPVTFISVGTPVNPDILPVELREREVAPRSRREVAEFVNNNLID